METFSNDGDKDIGGDGNPDLGLYRIFGSSVEGLDAEMLLDPFEEQFDLPSAFVKFGYGRCRKDEISEPRIFLGPRDEKGEELSQDVEPFEVQVSAVHDVEGSRFWNQDVKDIDVMKRSIGDFNERGNVAAEIQERMHFNGGFMLTEGRPGKEGKAKVDGRGIQGVGGFFQFNAEVFIGVKGSRLGNQDLAEVSVHPPVPFFVCLGKGAPRYPASDTKMIELLPAGTETGLNISETFPVG